MISLVNPSTPRPEGQGLPSTRAVRLSSQNAQAEGLRVDPEWRFFTPPTKAGVRLSARRSLGAAEWVMTCKPRRSTGG